MRALVDVKVVRMNTITLLIYLDACLHGYISKERTPFLYRLTGEGFFGRIRTVPGFTQEAAMMTGEFPDKTDFFTWYRYSPNSSPFAWTRPLRLLKPLRRSRAYYPIKVGIRKVSSHIARRAYQDPAFIPLDILPYFEDISATLPKNLPDLASICRASQHTCFQQSMIYGYIGSKRCGSIFGPVIESIESKNPFDFYIAHIGELDGLGHHYGPHPDFFSEFLKEIDLWLFKIYGSIRRKGLKCNLIIASDHGMFDVRSIVDIEKQLKSLFLKVPKDYIYFLDSTIARFWFSNDKAKNLIEEMLLRIPNGHIVSEEEKKRYHIDFKHNGYGNLWFWLDRGCMIFPNFFQSLKSSKTKGMHGYLDDEEGALIVYSDMKNTKSIARNAARARTLHLTDVFRITRALAGF